MRYRSGLSAVTARMGGADCLVLFVGSQGDFAGLDQINLRIPHSLAGRGEVEVEVEAEGKSANKVKVNIK